MSYTIPIKAIQSLTHDVNRIKMDKPNGFEFTPGQATEVAINKEGWQDKKRPFTFTSLPENDFLEFTIKSYKDHEGVTWEVDQLNQGDQLIIDDAWGAIQYKGPGVFIAGGAGITPFISILRSLEAKNELNGNLLIFSNKTHKDVIMKEDFERMLGENFISTLTQESISGHEHGRINKDLIEKYVTDFKQSFYICGPDAMVKDISALLDTLGVDSGQIVFEE